MMRPMPDDTSSVGAVVDNSVVANTFTAKDLKGLMSTRLALLRGLDHLQERRPVSLLCTPENSHQLVDRARGAPTQCALQ